MDFKLSNYQPLPTNRSRRSKYHTLRKSKVLVNIGNDSVNVNLESTTSKKKKVINSILQQKNLIGHN